MNTRLPAQLPISRPNNGESKGYVSVQEIASELSIAPTTVYGWTQRGLLPSVKLPGRVLVRRADFEEFIASRTIKGPSERHSRARKANRIDVEKEVSRIIDRLDKGSRPG